MYLIVKAECKGTAFAFGCCCCCCGCGVAEFFWKMSRQADETANDDTDDCESGQMIRES